MLKMFAAIALSSTALAATPVEASTFIGLGDSITFGETDLRYIPSDGVRGYVDDFARTLEARTGDDIDVINLAIDGETSASFFAGFGRTPPVVGRNDLPLALQNTNYSGLTPLSQMQQFIDAVSSVNAAGGTVSTISLSLGFNELAALAALPTDAALAAIPGTLDAYRMTFDAVLSQITTTAPDADLFVLGYFNPFPGDDNASPNPASPIFSLAGPQLNALIEELAGKYGATFVNTAPIFAGREAELTFIDEVGNGDFTPPPYSPFDRGLAPIGNVHPTEEGYGLIAQALASAAPMSSAVPEPGTWMMMILGFGGIGLSMRRARRKEQTAASGTAEWPALV